MQAIVLAGGFGTRLQNVVKNIPKPMAPIGDKPFLFYLLSYLKNHNFSEVVISVHYLKEQIEEFFGSEFKGMSIKYAVEEQPLGTGGAIINSLKYIDHSKPVIVLNGDTFLEVDYKKLLNNHCESLAKLTIVLKYLEDSSRYGLVSVDSNNIVTDFSEKSEQRQSGYINSGIYVLDPRISKVFHLPERFSFEVDFLQKYTRDISINSYQCQDYFIDIGVPEDYKKSQNEIPKLLSQKLKLAS